MMRQTYGISGMTCNGCRTGVEEKLKTVSGVKSVVVNLEKAEAQIEMERPIRIEMLRGALPAKYTIQAKDSENSNVNDTKSGLTQLFPLLLIFGYITVASFLLNKGRSGETGFMLDFMGLFYIVFSFFKMLDVKAFSESFRMYDPLAKKLRIYGLAYPFIETVLGLMFLMRIEVDIALYATIVVLGVTTIGVTRVLIDKKTIQCACLGTALKLPMTKATFIENSIMIVMALLMLSDVF